MNNFSKNLLSGLRRWIFLIPVALLSISLIWLVPVLVSSKATSKNPKNAKPENYDIRDDASALGSLNQRLRNANGLKPEAANDLASSMKDGKKRLSGQRPNSIVAWNPNTKAPEVVGVISADAKLTNRSKEDRVSILRNFLQSHSDLYGLNKSQVYELRTVSNYTNPKGNMSFVELAQEIDGIPVFQANVVAGFTRNNELIQTSGPLVPGLDYEKLASARDSHFSRLDAENSAAEAVSAAAGTIGVRIDPDQLVVKEVSEDGTSVVFEAGPFAGDIKLDLMYFPLESGSATLSWGMTLWEDVAAYYTFVDAEGGELLWRKNITNDQTQSATYSFYNDDSPAPLSPFPGLPGSNTQAPAISRTTLTTISELPAFDNLGWLTDGATTTTGNNVDAGLDLAAPNGIDSNGRPVSANRIFVYDYDPAPGIPGGVGSNLPTDANYRAGAVTNMFVWTNRYHDILYQYGFTEAARNFQQDNFGRNPGGSTANARNGNDRVLAEAQDYSGTNNANFSTPADGSSGRMQMYIWSGPTPNRDGDLDQNISIHEMTHGTSNRLHNNGSGLNAVISGGMGEGWSDFYARMILSSADEDVDGIFNTGGYGTYLAATGYTDNYYYGIRRFPSVVKSNLGPNGKPHNPLTLADIDPNLIDLSDGAYARGPFGVGGDAGAVAVHNIGEVWSIALFEVRARIIKRMGYAAGNARMMQLTTDAMKLEGSNPTHLVGRNALLAADVAFGSEDALDIWAGFATRGMGFGASISPQAQLTSGTRIQNVVESFDFPIPGMGTVVATDSACNSDGNFGVGEKVTLSVPLTNPLSAEIANVSAQVTGGGSADFGSIAPGETVTRDITYQVPSNVACGSKITVNVVVESDLGTETKTFKLQIGTPTAVYTENFDGVTAPSLPAGWTAAGTPAWTNSTASVDSAPNAAATTFASTTQTAELVSPAVSVPATGGQLTFRHSYNSEFAWDGGVLEISINGGAFVDIVDAGGTFETGSYNWAFNRTADGNTSVLQARAGWTGTSGGYITSTVDLPASANGQSVRFKFRAASDSSTTVGNSHWRIDSIVLNGFICPSLATTTTVNSSAGQYSDAATLSATVSSDCDYPEGSLEFRVDGVLVATVPVNGNGTYSTSYTIVNAPGNHTIAANFVSSNPYFSNSSGGNTLNVTKEDASVAFPDSNPFSVKVNTAGGTAGPVTICADITEVSDGSAGNITNATASFSISPVAGGSSPATGPVVYSGGGVGGTRRACVTLTNVAVDVYDITVTVGGYYQGTNSTVLAIYDPSLGFVTGGGTVSNNGNRANFGFSVKYLKNGKPQGSVLYVEHLPDGSVVKIKSNSMQSLSIVNNIAVIQTKATVNGTGNYNIRATAVDNGEPGSSDQLGLQSTNPDNTNVPSLTFPPRTISGGNISLPLNARLF